MHYSATYCTHSESLPRVSHYAFHVDTGCNASWPCAAESGPWRISYNMLHFCLPVVSTTWSLLGTGRNSGPKLEICARAGIEHMLCSPSTQKIFQEDMQYTHAMHATLHNILLSKGHIL